MYRLFDPLTQGIIIMNDVQFNETYPPLEFIKPRVTLNFPSSFVAPIYVTSSSTFVHDIDPSSFSYSSYPPLCFKYTSVVPTTTPLRVWAQKILESVGSKVGIPSHTQWNRVEFSLMTKVLATNDPSNMFKLKINLNGKKQ